jgi:hypothetical protein
VQVANISIARYKEISGREPETAPIHASPLKILSIRAAQDAKCKNLVIELDNQILQFE